MEDKVDEEGEGAITDVIVATVEKKIDFQTL